MASRAMIAAIRLLSNGSATSPAYTWPGGMGTFLSEHTGGTVTLEYQSPNPSGGTWTACGPDTTLAATGGGVFYLPPDTQIRAAVAGATGVYAIVHQVQNPGNA